MSGIIGHTLYAQAVLGENLVLAGPSFPFSTVVPHNTYAMVTMPFLALLAAYSLAESLRLGSADVRGESQRAL